MQNQFDYEWDVEILDEHGDIVDHCFQSSARDMVRHFNEQTPGSASMVLVWTEGNDADGVTDRAWAYLTPDKSLPEFFGKPDEHGVYQPIMQRIPKRFHEELRKAVLACAA